MTSRFALPASRGTVLVELRDGWQPAHWRYQLAHPSDIVVDFLDPGLVHVDGVEYVERQLPEGFIPTPRLRLSVNGVVHELVSSDSRVLERHYARPHHQELAYARPDAWTAAYHLARIRQVRRLLRGVHGAVCDVGSGYSLVDIAGPWPFRLSACDRDAAAVSALQARGIDARVAPAEAPPFERGSFDAVFAGEIIEHLGDPEMALRRWVELLRPGGRLVVTTPNRRHLLTRVRGYAVVENQEHLFEWDIRELRDALQRAGVHVTRIEGLALPVPVPVPGRGWRDLVGAASRRVAVPRAALVRVIEAGRVVPALAADLAAVGRRQS
jgi:SAM-dependent methyltransferase